MLRTRNSAEASGTLSAEVLSRKPRGERSWPASSLGPFGETHDGPVQGQLKQVHVRRAQARKPKWAADDCYHVCCEGGPVVKPLARKDPPAGPPGGAAASPAAAKAGAAAAAAKEEPKQASAATIREAKEAKVELVKELEKDASDVVGIPNLLSSAWPCAVWLLPAWRLLCTYAHIASKAGGVRCHDDR